MTRQGVMVNGKGLRDQTGLQIDEGEANEVVAAHVEVKNTTPIDMVLLGNDGTIINNNFMTYEEINHQVVAVKNNNVYARSLSALGELYKSTDNGSTWTKIWTAPGAEQISVAHITSAGTVIVFTSNGKVYRGPNDANFTLVNTGAAPPLGNNAVDSIGAVVCYGEYTLAEGTDVKLYASTDDGATWTTALNTGAYNANGIRHFHTCQYFPEFNRWIATTGDTNCNWYISSNGTSWTNIVTSTSQYRRTLGLVAKSYTEIIWSCDGTRGFEGVYSTNLINQDTIKENDITKILSLPHTSYAIKKAGSTIVVGTMVTDTYTKDRTAYLYVSRDSGNSWQLENSFEIDPAETTGGINDIIGPDIQGNYYIILRKCEGYSSYATIKASPRPFFDNVRFSDKPTLIKNPSNYIENVFVRGIRSTNSSTTVRVPPSAKGAIVTSRVWAATGDTPGYILRSSLYFSTLGAAGPRVSTASQTGASNVAHIWKEGAGLSNAEARLNDAKFSNVWGADNFNIGLDFTGTFAGGEGFDLDVNIFWLF